MFSTSVSGRTGTQLRRREGPAGCSGGSARSTALLKIVGVGVPLQTRLVPWQHLLQDVRIEQQVRIDLQARPCADREAVRIPPGRAGRAAPGDDRLANAIDHLRSRRTFGVNSAACALDHFRPARAHTGAALVEDLAADGACLRLPDRRADLAPHLRPLRADAIAVAIAHLAADAALAGRLPVGHTGLGGALEMRVGRAGATVRCRHRAADRAFRRDDLTDPVHQFATSAHTIAALVAVLAGSQRALRLLRLLALHAPAVFQLAATRADAAPVLGPDLALEQDAARRYRQRQQLAAAGTALAVAEGGALRAGAAAGRVEHHAVRALVLHLLADGEGMARIGLAAIALHIGRAVRQHVAALHRRVRRQHADAVLPADRTLQIGKPPFVGEHHGDVVRVAFTGTQRQIGDAGCRQRRRLRRAAEWRVDRGDLDAFQAANAVQTDRIADPDRAGEGVRPVIGYGDLERAGRARLAFSISGLVDTDGRGLAALRAGPADRVDDIVAR